MIDTLSAPTIDFDFEIVIKLQLLTISMYFFCTSSILAFCICQLGSGSSGKLNADPAL